MALQPISHERERQILKAAARLFAEKGFDVTSMQDIADEVGLSKPALYYYFKSKNDIVDFISERATRELFEQVTRASRHGTSTERVTAFMCAHARYFEEHYYEFLTMMFGWGWGEVRDRRTLEIRDAYEAYLRDLIREGAGRGEFATQDAVLAGRATLSLLNWMIRWYKPDGPLRAEEYARQLAHLLLHGLRSPEGPHPPPVFPA